MTDSLHPESTVVAFLGIGLMGLPMANNLLTAGYRLRVWNRTREKAEALYGEQHLQIVDSAEEALNGADVVITMLENGKVVEDVLYSRNSYLSSPENCLFIEMSSIPPDTARNHHRKLADSGRRYLDAPVSGGTVGAAQASLSIMVGGEQDSFDRARSLFETLGDPTFIGPPGTGQMTKLANQAIVGITIGAVSEALLLASAGGADPAAVRKALSGGFAGSRILEIHGQRMIDRDFAPGATSRVQLKDLQTVLDAADDHQMTLPLTRQVFEQYQQLIKDGGEEFDHSALLLQLERINAPWQVSPPTAEEPDNGTEAS